MTLRSITPLNLPNLAPALVATRRPRFKNVDPRTLMVDEQYQRDLTSRSVSLISRIVAEWRWEAFKPPVCVEAEGAVHVIDGQHTAIAAATHGGFDTIPVMIVDAVEVAARADAFVRHNRDRIAVSATELYFAHLAAGDPDALTISQVCDRAGVRILKLPPSYGRFRAGDTMAIGVLRRLVDRRHPIGARRVLEIAVKARVAPVTADIIKAVEHLLFADEYRGEVAEEDIASVLLMAVDLDDEARRWSVEHKVPRWRALASILFMKRRRRRG